MPHSPATRDVPFLERQLVAFSPVARWQYVTVTFGSANTDYDIPHTLRVTDPEAVNYQVVRADRATSIYHNQAAGRTTWKPGYILLRSSIANAVVRLLLTVEQP